MVTIGQNFSCTESSYYLEHVEISHNSPNPWFLNLYRVSIDSSAPNKI